MLRFVLLKVLTLQEVCVQHQRQKTGRFKVSLLEEEGESLGVKFKELVIQIQFQTMITVSSVLLLTCSQQEFQ